MSKEEIISKIAQLTFFVFGVATVFLSGLLLQGAYLLSCILFFLGVISLIIQVEYIKEEAVKQ